MQQFIKKINIISFQYFVQAVSAIVIALVVLKLIVFFNTDNFNGDYWNAKFTELSVPANFHPGGDARNIQLTSFCETTTVTQVEFDQCYLDASIIEVLPDNVNVPPYNYPKVWVTVYKFFGDYSEDFFINFWKLNAGMFVVTLLVLALKTAPAVLPVAIFSPAALLTIERGNIDALTFAIFYIPFLLGLRSQFLNAFCLGIATAAKIFPIFAVLVFLQSPFQKHWKAALCGFLVAAPLIIYSFFSLGDIVSNTPQTFWKSYGFMSLQYGPFFRGRDSLVVIALLIFTTATVAWVAFAGKRDMYRLFVAEIMTKKSWEIYLFSTAIFIFGLTFIFFVNYAYRLIFLFPALFVVSTMTTHMAKALFTVMVLILWTPFFALGWTPFSVFGSGPFYNLGWMLQNYSCYLLFFLLSPVYFAIGNQMVFWRSDAV